MDGYVIAKTNLSMKPFGVQNILIFFKENFPLTFYKTPVTDICVCFSLQKKKINFISFAWKWDINLKFDKRFSSIDSHNINNAAILTGHYTENKWTWPFLWEYLSVKIQGDK